VPGILASAVRRVGRAAAYLATQNLKNNTEEIRGDPVTVSSNPVFHPVDTQHQFRLLARATPDPILTGVTKEITLTIRVRVLAQSRANRKLSTSLS
jgi:hypothetical protein